MTPTIWYLVALALAGGIIGFAGATLVLAAASRGHGPMDSPGGRRTHLRDTARGGGIGIIVAGAVARPFAQWSSGPHDGYLIAVLILAWATPNAFIGLTDDHHPLDPGLKLALQLIAAVIAVALGLRLSTLHLAPLPAVDLGALSWPLSVLWLVWIANLFNFMDGADGLAAGCGAIFFGVFATLALLVGSVGSAMLAICLAGASLGFFVLNRPPARIFMGDGGSLFCGSVLGGGTLLLNRHELAGVPIAVFAMALAPFLFDATYTLIRRILNHEAILHPHHQHLYQRLLDAGWSSPRVLMLYAIGSVVTGVGALIFWRSSGVVQVCMWLVLGGAMSGLVALTRAIESRA